MTWQAALSVAGAVIAVLLAVCGSLLMRILSKFDRMEAKLGDLPVELVRITTRLDSLESRVSKREREAEDISRFLSKHHGFVKRGPDGGW